MKLTREQIHQELLKTKRPKPIAEWNAWFLERGWKRSDYFGALLVNDPPKITLTRTRKKKDE